MDASLTLAWTAAPTQWSYWYGATCTRFSAQVGHSTTPGQFVSAIFHADLRGAVWGGEAATVEDAQAEAEAWLSAHAKPAGA